MKYYGLISGLPVPKPGQALVFNLMDLRQQIEPYLEGRDLAAIHHFFYRIDLANLESLIYGQNRWLRGGNMTEAGKKQDADRIGPDLIPRIEFEAFAEQLRESLRPKVEGSPASTPNGAAATIIAANAAPTHNMPLA